MYDTAVPVGRPSDPNETVDSEDFVPDRVRAWPSRMTAKSETVARGRRKSMATATIYICDALLDAVSQH